MAALELWGGSLQGQFVALDGERVTVGSGSSADVVVDDPTVSSLHAILERIGTTWLIRDLGSRNGTKLNGAELVAQLQLRHDDTVHLGATRAMFRDRAAERRPITAALSEPPPGLTAGERRVLVELCRPLLEHNAFQAPASVGEMAVRLYVGRNAVQVHLTNMYAKFGIYPDEHANRRLALANAAIERGAVTRGDLHSAERLGRDR
jgi:hypothetical protein